jgi:hypothetical protein
VNPLALLNPGRWAIYLALIAALGLGYVAWEHHIRADERAKVVSEYNAKIDAIQAEARTLLRAESARVDAANRALRDFNDQQENTDVVNTKAIELLADKLHTIKLHDPSQVAGCGSSGSSTQVAVASGASVGATNTSSGTGVFSQQLTDYLIGQARSADSINLAYISCRSTLINERIN